MDLLQGQAKDKIRELIRTMNTRSLWICMLLSMMFIGILGGCSSKDEAGSALSTTEKGTAPPAVTTTKAAIHEQPSTVYYEIFVRSFYDSNGDGIGDLKGVTQQLDYLKDLGIGGIWLMPINSSPSYHGYDVTDYYGINPAYGTLADFQELLKQAHQRDIKVIMDLVVNHTSSEHPWFKSAVADPNSPYRDWYTWAKPGETLAPDGATGANPWHTSATGNYLGIFWGGMPDLNMDNPAVREEMIKTGQYWLKQGVDGFRLDAAKHIYEDFKSEANKKETKEKNVAWWQEFRQGMNEVNPNTYLVGEVWDSTAKIGPFLDDALDSCFNFDLAKSILGMVQSESPMDIGFTLERIYDFYNTSSQGKFIDATFLSNHDGNRVMSDLAGNINQAKMAASVLLTLPGNPFIYYGEEIGMKGMKPDELIREPMLWSETSDEGLTTWEPRTYNTDISIAVSKQSDDPNSLLAHYKQMIAWRNEMPALRDGAILSYAMDQTKAVSYQRITQQAKALVVHNITKEAQTVTLPDTMYSKLKKTTSESSKLTGTTLELAPYSTVILE